MVTEGNCQLTNVVFSLFPYSFEVLSLTIDALEFVTRTVQSNPSFSVCR